MAVTDLTGYTWVGKQTDIGGLLGSTWSYTVDFYLTALGSTFSRHSIYTSSGASLENDIYYDTDLVYNPDLHWESNYWRTITFTGGTDVTNTNLISWLEANGTLTAPVVTTGSTYIGSTPLDKCYVGSDEVQKIYVGDELVYEKQESGPVSFATDSWATIATAIKSGNDPYSLGDTKTDTITIGANTYTGTFKIVDNLVGRYTTQSGSSHKVIELQELVHNTSGPGSSNGFAWRASYSTGTGYPYSQSDLADNSVNTMDTTILAMLPSDLQAVLETTTVKSGPGNTTATASNLSSVSSKLFCAALNEYYQDAYAYSYANNYETDNKGQFTYYKNLGVTSSNYSALIKNKIEDDTAWLYWMRSPYRVSSSLTVACNVHSTGECSGSRLSSSNYRVAPCFTW